MAETILKQIKTRLEIVDDIWDAKLLATINDVAAVALHNGFKIELPIEKTTKFSDENTQASNQFVLRAITAKAIQQLDPTAFPSLFQFTDKDYYEALSMLRLEALVNAQNSD